jgi:uncharacterized membrane protein YgdD (TMEM256/DUF423 family)
MRQRSMQRLWIGLGAAAGLLAVAMAAAAAHLLPERLPPAALALVDTAVQIQAWHALALVLTGLWAGQRGGRLADLAGAAFAFGTVVFCGALYLIGLAGLRVGPAPPVGGMALMVGWLLLGLSALRRG